MLKNFYIILFSFSVLCSCHKDYDNSQTISTDAEPEIRVDTEVTGKITESDGETVEKPYDIVVNGDNISLGNYFFKEEVKFARKYGQLFTVFSEGEERAKVFTTLIENDINYLDIHLFPSWSEADLSSDNAVDVSTTRLEIANVVNQTGTSAGNSRIMSYGSLAERKWFRQLGAHAYKDINTLLSLDVKDAFYFSVEDQNGNQLLLDKNDPSRIVHNLGENDLALFHLNEEASRWEYLTDFDPSNTADISLTGYFIIAAYQEGIYASGELVKDDQPISYQLHRWSSGNFMKESFTSLGGKWLGIIPQQADVVYEVTDLCDNEIAVFSLESENVNLENIRFDITTESEHLYKLKTVVIDCDGNIQEEASVKITDQNGELVFAFDNNEIDTWISVCEENFSISAYGIDKQVQGPSIEWNLDIEEPIRYLSDCPDYIEGFSYLKIRNDIKLYAPFQFSNDGIQSVLEATGGEVKFIFDNGGVGSYEQQEIRVRIDDEEEWPSGYFVACENSLDGCGISDFYVTHYEVDSNGWIRVSFAGAIWMQTISPATAGNFPIEGVILCKAG